MPRGAKPMTKEAFIEKARAMHGDTYDYSKVVYRNNRTPVEIICPEHGSFWQRPGDHLQKRRGCPACRGGVKYTRETFVAKAQKLFPDYDYSLVEYVNASTPVTVVCPVHGEFTQKPAELLQGHGCQLCGYSKRHTPVSDQKRYEHAQETWRAQGYENPMQNPDVVARHIDTRRQNGSFSRTSRVAQETYKVLVNHFGVDDVVCEYRDKKRYPFHCDFYIRSLDAFIEVNSYWGHNSHWFDPDNVDDVHELEKWQRRLELGHTNYKTAIQVWTDYDVRKREYARRYGLCYIVFWTDNVRDVVAWINAGCPDRYDWM